MGIDICVLVGRRLQAIRKEKRVYQADLAERAGITRRNLSKIENGHAEPGLRTLYRIAKALDTGLDRILRDL